MIEQKKVGGNRSGGTGNFFELASSNESCGIRAVTVLQDLACDLGTRADRQITQFDQRLIGAELRLGSRPCDGSRSIPSRLRHTRQAFAWRALSGSIIEPYQERALFAHARRQDLGGAPAFT